MQRFQQAIQLCVKRRQKKKVPPNEVAWRALLQAEIAQLGERQTEDLEVPGSIPGLGTTFFFVFDECLYFKHKTSKLKFLGNESTGSGVAQWLACWAHNSKVGGSKPLSATF